ncbi:MAG: adenosine deaminase [Desulfobacterales bacterium]|nr:adenosine deaminase [Desulfobacterales bacterium]
MMTDINDILRKIPKSELHVHLRGAIPLETIIKLINKHTAGVILGDIPLWKKAAYGLFGNIRPFLSQNHWSLDALPDLFNYKYFNQFLMTFDFTSYLIRDASDLWTLITDVLENLKSQNIVYAEILITALEYVNREISLSDIKDCLDKTNDYPGIRVQWIVDLVRNSGRKGALAKLEKIMDLECKNIVGISLGGSERLFPAKRFSKVFSKARENGLRLTIHAGEAAGPQSVWDALQILGSERIGHGVRAIEDTSLVTYLAENNIPLEISPTSNLLTRIYSSYEAHPVKALFEAGVPVTINTDDPTFFRTTLADEYAHVHAMGVKDHDIFRLIRNGFVHAFLPQNEIDDYLFHLEKEWERLSLK